MVSGPAFDRWWIRLLANLSPWAAHKANTARLGLRRLFPPSGRQYELWDCSMLLLLVAIIGYVFTEPTSAVRGALAFQVEGNPQVWGTFLGASALLGSICSYRNEWVRVGYALVITAASFWAASFALGVLVGGPIRGLVSVLIYAWVARRLIREGFTE